MRLEEFISDIRIDEFIGEMTPDDLPDPYNQMAELIGIENTVKIINNFGGLKIYFPKGELVIKRLRNGRIFKEYNGRNLRQLAWKYGLTENWLRTIIRRNKHLLKRN